MSDTSIRLSEETKRRLVRRKRGGESFEAVIERLLEEDRDPLAGFGAWSETGKVGAAREAYDRSRRRSRDRIEEIADRRESAETPR